MLKYFYTSRQLSLTFVALNDLFIPILANSVTSVLDDPLNRIIHVNMLSPQTSLIVYATNR